MLSFFQFTRKLEVVDALPGPTLAIFCTEQPSPQIADREERVTYGANNSVQTCLSVVMLLLKETGVIFGVVGLAMVILIRIIESLRSEVSHGMTVF